jgi:phosphate transport system substrate-binding protein
MARFFYRGPHLVLPPVRLGSALLLLLILSACGAQASITVPASDTTASFACSASTADLGPAIDLHASAPAAGATGKLTIDGSTALAPLVSRAQDEFVAANPGASITVNGGGSLTGLADVEQSAVQIGDSDIFAQQANSTAYADLVDHQVAVVIFAVVVNPDVTITNLTQQQLQQIFAGTITTWDQVGGPHEFIDVIERPPTSGTRATFLKYVMQGQEPHPSQQLLSDDSNGIGALVAQTPGAISYIATSFIAAHGAYQGKIKPLCIDGAKPSSSAVASNQYHFWNFEHLYTKGSASGLAKQFITYLSSTAFQQSDLPSLSFLPVSALSPAAAASHQP